MLYDLEINPNRPDAMSVAGVARDLAARLGLPFAIPEPQVTEVAGERGAATDAPPAPGVPAAERPATTADAVVLVAAGVGVLVVPQSLARLHHRKDVVYRRLDGAPLAPVALAWVADRGDDLVEEMIGIVRGRTVNSSRGRSATPDDASAGAGQPGGGRERSGGGGFGEGLAAVGLALIQLDRVVRAGRMDGDLGLRLLQGFSDLLPFRARIDNAHRLQIFQPKQEGADLALVGIGFDGGADLPLLGRLLIHQVQHDFRRRIGQAQAIGLAVFERKNFLAAERHHRLVEEILDRQIGEEHLFV